MTTVANRIAQLPPEKLALLMQRLAKKKEGAAHTTIPHAGREANTFPLSFTQQRQWFMEQLMPGAVYNVPQAIRLSGALDVAVLERALTTIVGRHEALRTTFQVVDGQPSQVIAPLAHHDDASPLLPIVDLRALAPDARAAETARIAGEEARRHFDIASGPLWRTTLLRLAGEEHVLIITMHHIVSDGWSVAVAMRELAALYTAYTQGKPVELPELPIQYADFAVWQRQWLQAAEEQAGSPVQRQLAYWKQQLDGAPALLELPTDRPRPPAQTYHGAIAPFMLSRAATDALRTLGDREGATIFMAVLAAFDALLARYSGQSDICVGTPIANRTLPELEGLIGLFINTLVLRTDLSGDPSFAELLGRVRRVALEAYAHQDLPFEKVVEAVQPERNPSYSPLFQALFVYSEAAAIDVQIPGLGIRPLQLHSGTAQFDLSLYLSETSDGLQGFFEYNADLFDAATIALLSSHLQGLLERSTEQPDQRLSALVADIPIQKLNIVLASAFTAEPLRDSLDFWMAELRIPSRIRFSPYSQIFQQLLDPASLLATNHEGVNVIVLRLEDWAQKYAGPNAGLFQVLEQNVQDFLDGLESFTGNTPAPCIVCICPPSPAITADPERAAFLGKLDRLLRRRIAGLAGVSLLHYVDMLKRYSVETVQDPRGDELGHIPYTPELFAALGTGIAESIVALRAAPAA
jgi:hypothetical protein